MLVWILAAAAVVSITVALVAKAWGPNRKLVETTGPTFIERFNQAVRGLVTIGLSAAFIWGFLIGRISGDVFTSVFAGILGYWFASRDSKTRDMLPPTTTTRTPDTTVVTAPTQPTAG